MSWKQVVSGSGILAALGLIATIATPEIRDKIGLTDLIAQTTDDPRSPVPSNLERMSGEYHGQFGFIDAYDNAVLTMDVLPSGDFTGTLVGVSPLADPNLRPRPITGKISGDRIRIVCTAELPHVTGSFILVGKITEDSMSGTFNFQIERAAGVDFDQIPPQDKIQIAHMFQDIERRSFWIFKR